MARVLRLARSVKMVSAAVFENLFQSFHASWFDVTSVDPFSWLEKFLSDDAKQGDDSQLSDAMLIRFEHAVAEYDYICPGFEALHQVPLLLHMRNLSDADVRLMLICHSPGVYGYILGILSLVIRPGDILISPGKHGSKIIGELVPTLKPHVHTIHHPMSMPAVFSGLPEKCRNRLVTMGRIVPDKKIDRQLDALAYLVNKLGYNAEMWIAGETHDQVTGEPTLYFRCLIQRLKRLKLENRVRFCGLIDNTIEKEKFLSEATVMLYLSCTLEETFPKAALEALGRGIPVVAPDWNGFSEVVGSGGRLVPLLTTPDGSVDIDVIAVAEAVRDLLENPIDPEICREQAGHFDAGLSENLYRKLADDKVNKAGAENVDTTWKKNTIMADHLGGGLLAAVTGFGALPPKTVFREYLDFCKQIRASQKNKQLIPLTLPAAATERLVSFSLKRELERRYAGKGYPENHAIEKKQFAGNFATLKSFPERLPAMMENSENSDHLGASLNILMHAGYNEEAHQLLEICRGKKIITPMIQYTEIWLLSQHDAERAQDLFLQEFGGHVFRVNEHTLLVLLTQIVTKTGDYHIALPILADWLQRYPDEVASGRLWLAYAECLWEADAWHDGRMEECLVQVKGLFGDHPAVAQLEDTFLAASSTMERIGETQ